MSYMIQGRAFVGGTIHENTVIRVDNGIITEVDPAAGSTATFGDALIVPGFIDVHVHGAAGSDFMDASAVSIERILSHHASHGTTCLAATTLSGSPSAVAAAIREISVASLASRQSGAEIAAIHVEGPFINARRAGAQDLASLRPADIGEVEGWLAAAPHLRWIITVAPEVEGVWAVLERYREQVTFSIGHTDATYGEVLDAMVRGATHFTHLFNAMRPFHQREPGPVGAALLSNDATAELIADGVHVHPAVLRIAARALDGRVALVTDAMRACGMPEGTYKLYEHDVIVNESGARLRDGTLAGSTLTMDRAVANMVELAGLPLESVIPLATSVPARLIGVQHRKGRIEVGYDADLVVLNPKLQIERVIVRGVEAG